MKVHDVVGSDKTNVTEYCGYCKAILSQRESTNEIERLRKDILRLQNRYDSGELYLSDVLHARKQVYTRLLRESGIII